MYKSTILRKIGSGYVIESEEIEKSEDFSVISVDIFRYEVLVQIWNTTLLLLFFFQLIAQIDQMLLRWSNVQIGSMTFEERSTEDELCGVRDFK